MIMAAPAATTNYLAVRHGRGDAVYVVKGHENEHKTEVQPGRELIINLVKSIVRGKDHTGQDCWMVTHELDTPVTMDDGSVVSESVEYVYGG